MLTIRINNNLKGLLQTLHQVTALPSSLVALGISVQ